MAKQFGSSASFLLNLQALGTRIAALRSRGRRIVVVGDLNISPDHIDSCEPGWSSPPSQKAGIRLRKDSFLRQTILS